MARPAAKKAAAPPPADDPLADLRDPDDRYEGTQEGPGDPGGDPANPGATDPLADVVEAALGGVEASWRQALGVETPREVQEYVQAIQETLVADLRPLVEPVAVLEVQEAVERWHADTVAMGFLHKGGRCGCHYIARVILGA